MTEAELSAVKKKVQREIKEAVNFADESPMPPVELAKEVRMGAGRIAHCLLRLTLLATRSLVAARVP